LSSLLQVQKSLENEVEQVEFLSKHFKAESFLG